MASDGIKLTIVVVPVRPPPTHSHMQLFRSQFCRPCVYVCLSLFSLCVYSFVYLPANANESRNPGGRAGGQAVRQAIHCVLGSEPGQSQKDITRLLPSSAAAAVTAVRTRTSPHTKLLCIKQIIETNLKSYSYYALDLFRPPNSGNPFPIGFLGILLDLFQCLTNPRLCIWSLQRTNTHLPCLSVAKEGISI